jgi:hypothetical protein
MMMMTALDEKTITATNIIKKITDGEDITVITINITERPQNIIVNNKKN